MSIHVACISSLALLNHIFTQCLLSISIIQVTLLGPAEGSSVVTPTQPLELGLEEVSVAHRDPYHKATEVGERGEGRGMGGSGREQELLTLEGQIPLIF